MTEEDKDRIIRAEEIQLYTENRCQALEKENVELKEKLEMSEKIAADNPGLFIENCNLKAEIAELKAHCKAVDEVNAKMKCCGNCKKIFICRKADVSGMGSFPYNCKDWELAE